MLNALWGTETGFCRGGRHLERHCFSHPSVDLGARVRPSGYEVIRAEPRHECLVNSSMVDGIGATIDDRLVV